MRVVKIVFACVVLVFLAIVVVQNLDVFMEKKSLQLNLFVWSDVSPEIPLSVYFLSCFLIGFLASYFSSLAERFRARRSITGQSDTIRRLEEEIRTLRIHTSPDDHAQLTENGIT
jgi:uncharacterized integral membrane protein